MESKIILFKCLLKKKQKKKTQNKNKSIYTLNVEDYIILQ